MYPLTGYILFCYKSYIYIEEGQGEYDLPEMENYFNLSIYLDTSSDIVDEL